MATWPAASGSSTDVMAAIALASTGDTVTIPAGSTSWAAGSVTVNKAITIQGVCTAQGTIGAGTSTTIIDVAGTPGSVTFEISQTTAGIIWIKGIQFVNSNNANQSTHPIQNDGTWGVDRPTIFQNCTFNNTDATTIHSNVAGGLIFDHCTYNGTWNSFLLTVKDLSSTGQTSWTTNDTMGANDTTGEKNVYIESSIFNGGANGVVDADDNCRIVDRYNQYNRSGGFNSHGWDTSPYGCRHWELYENDYNYQPDPANSGQGTQEAPYTGISYNNNVNFYMWFRGGTGVIFNNDFEDILSSGSSGWGDKTEMHATIRGIMDSVGSGSGPFPGGCGTVSYPCPRQLGQSYYNGSYITDPIYIWNNTGTFTFWGSANFSTWGNPCSLPDYSVFWQSGRDYIASGGDGKGATGKSGYTAYTYPHPLLAGGGGGGGGTTALTRYTMA